MIRNSEYRLESAKSAIRRSSVSIGDGLVLWHTREEWDALMHGVEREASTGMQADLDAFLGRERLAEHDAAALA